MSKVLRAVLALATTHLVVLLAWYFFGAYGIKRHHLESASFVSASVALLTLLFSPPRSPSLPAGVADRHLGLVILLVAGVAYAGAVGVGLLSDDYVLRSWVLDGRLRGDGSPFLRPAALMLWRVVFLLGGGAVVLHLLNVLLHITNTILAAHVAARLGLSRLGVLAATAVFLVWPTQVEPVVWAAGVFDVLSTTWMLLALLIWLTEPAFLSERLSVLAVCVLTVLSLLTKESAVALPALALVAVTPRLLEIVQSRRQIALLFSMVGLTLAYMGWRLWLNLPVAGTATLTRYVMKEQLSRTFGTLAVPLSEATIQSHPAIACLAVATLIVLGTLSIVTSSQRSRGQVVAVQGLVWCVVAAAPTIGVLFIGPYLDGSRYLYLSALGWGLVIGGILDALSNRRSLHRLGVAFVAGLVVVAAVEQRSRLADWRAAAAERDAILGAAIRLADRAQCGTTTARNLPPRFNGAQLFTNGFAEALREARPVATGSRPCQWTWTGSELRQD
ncbi:MAG TPA: hypothetical protein VF921_02295 [Vicinamibacterales bacterium]